MIRGGEVVWVVAEAPDGAVIGSAAAVRNIGAESDRIAEVFGVVVDTDRRYRGLGSALLRRLVEELADSAEFILCEARTVEAGGWKVARNAGFLPVGYEPYAHAMPVGYESMVLSGRCRRNSGRWPHRDKMARATPQVLCLAKAVLGADQLVNPPTVFTGTDSPIEENREDRRGLNLGLDMRRDETLGRAFFNATEDIFDRRSGIVGLNPLQGLDRWDHRFENIYFIASSRGANLGAARVTYDRIDARAHPRATGA